jgi:hypothetical protein
MGSCRSIRNSAQLAAKRPLSLLHPEFLDFIPQNLVPAYKEGRLFYDDATHTLTLYNDISNTSLQLGLEQWIRVRNHSGLLIEDGSTVVITSAIGQTPTIQKAISTANSAYQVIGLVIADIADNGYGWVTVLGNLNNINTNALTEGAPFYLSDTVYGGWTVTAPYNAIQLGVCLYKHSQNGKLLCRVSDANPYLKKQVVEIANHYTGFEMAGCNCEYDPVNRTVTIPGSGVAYYYFKGDRKTLTLPYTTIAHPVTTGKLYYYRSSDGTNFEWTETPEFTDVLVAAVNYSATSAHRFGLIETHGAGRIPDHHRIAHLNIGTFIRSGGTLTVGSYQIQPASPANADNRPLFDATTVYDEDLPTTNAATASELYTRIDVAADGSISWDVDVSDIVKIGGTYPYYDLNGVDTELLTGNYMWVYFVAMPTTKDTQSQKFRFFCIPGSEKFTTAATALAAAQKYRIGNLGLLSPEFVVFRRVLLETNASYTTTGRFRIYAEEAITNGNRATASGGVGSVTASQVSNVPAGNIAATNVQSALNELDTEKAALTGATFTGGIVARALRFTQQSNTPTGTTYTWTLSSGNELTLTLTSSTGNVTVTTASPSAGTDSVLNVTGHATLSRDVTITQSGVTFVMTGKTSGNSITLDTLTANQRANYRLHWASTTLCYITRMVLV